jgi:tRNA nucleotidyltransferase (CCA-adding enzyme)
MVSVLHECGALARILPEVDRSFGSPAAVARLLERLDDAAARDYGLPVRFALLVLDVAPANAMALALRINAPHDCRDLARLAVQEGRQARRADLDAESALSLIERCDSLRRPERLERLIEVAECDARCERPPGFVARAFLVAALDAARRVDAGAAAREHPSDVPGAVRRARLAAVAGARKR